MEKLTFILNEDAYIKNYKEILELPIERQRRLFFGRQLFDVRYITKKETDTHIYWACHEKKPKFYNNKLFFAHTNRSGVTYDKKKKSIKIWFGIRYSDLPMELKINVLETFDMYWVMKLSNGISSLISNAIFGNIIKGKIKNAKDICQAYLKVAPYKAKDIDLELFTNVFSKLDMSPKSLSNNFIVAIDCNVLLQQIEKSSTNGFYFNTYIEILVEKASILNKNVDFNITNEEADKLCQEYNEIIRKDDIIYRFFKENDYE
jgi:hypothetical protein